MFPWRSCQSVSTTCRKAYIVKFCPKGSNELIRLIKILQLRILRSCFCHNRRCDYCLVRLPGVMYSTHFYYAVFIKTMNIAESCSAPWWMPVVDWPKRRLNPFVSCFIVVVNISLLSLFKYMWLCGNWFPGNGNKFSQRCSCLGLFCR